MGATPAMQFPLPAAGRRRSLLQTDEDANRDLFGGGGDKGSLGAQSAGTGMQATLQGKQFSMFPTQRIDTAYTPWDYRVACMGDGSWTDDASWTSISLRDDDSKVIRPAFGFRFGGSEYSSIFVGSNGYLTIGSRRTTYSGTISNHYSSWYNGQISAAFTDLNPSRGGTVKWTDETNMEKTGHFTVSYKDVRENCCAANTYSFQVTVFQSGLIEVYYETVPDTSSRVVVGLSVGKFPRDFVNGDITAVSDAAVDCAAQPEVAVALPITMRAPTQEFSTQFGASGRRLLAVDELAYNGELSGVQSASAGEKTPGFGAQSTGGNFFDLEDTTVTWAPLPDVAGVAVPGYSIACVDTGIAGLPMDDSTASTSLILGDDTSQQVSFTGGKTFTFFGTTYSSVYVGSNGYLTFGSGDSMYYSHRYYHYRMPRISAMFTDLNPTAGGTIEYKQLEDSICITFTDIKSYSGSNYFTFQFQLFFDTQSVVDGAIVSAIQPFTISWTRFTANSARAIVGVSAGALYSSVNYLDFNQWDLNTAAAACPADSDAASGANGILSSGKGDAGSIGSASTDGAPAMCPTNAFTVSVTTLAAPVVQAETQTPPAPPPVSAASRPVSMAVTLVVCLAALIFSTVM